MCVPAISRQGGTEPICLANLPDSSFSAGLLKFPCSTPHISVVLKSKETVLACNNLVLASLSRNLTTSFAVLYVQSCVQGKEITTFVSSAQKIYNSDVITISQGSNVVRASYDAAAPSGINNSVPPDIADDDTDSEAAVQHLLPVDSSCNRNMALSSEAIVQWMRGSSPGPAGCYVGTTSESTGTTGSTIHRSTSYSALSQDFTFKSHSVGERSQALLQKSISAIASIIHAMELSEYVMVVQLAGAPGVCKALLKSLANLVTRCEQS